MKRPMARRTQIRITSTQNFRAGRICAAQGTNQFLNAGCEDNHWQQLDFLRNVATHLRHESLQLHVVGLKLLCHVVNLHAGAAFRSADYEDAQRVVSAAQQEAV